MREFSVRAFIPKPASYLLHRFAEYTHVEKLHGHRNVWVKPLYEKDDVSICLWFIKIFGVVSLQTTSDSISGRVEDGK